MPSTPLITSSSSASLSSLSQPLEIENVSKSSKGGAAAISSQVRCIEFSSTWASAAFTCDMYGILDTKDVGQRCWRCKISSHRCWSVNLMWISLVPSHKRL